MEEEEEEEASEVVGGKEDKKIKRGGGGFPPHGIFGFICAEDVGCEDKDKLAVNGPKKKMPRSLP